MDRSTLPDGCNFDWLALNSPGTALGDSTRVSFVPSAEVASSYKQEVDSGRGGGGVAWCIRNRHTVQVIKPIKTINNSFHIYTLSADKVSKHDIPYLHKDLTTTSCPISYCTYLT